MPHGIAWSDDIAETVIRMSGCKEDEEITAMTGVPGRSIRRMRKLWLKTGLPYIPKDLRRRRTGRSRILSIADLAVSTLPHLRWLHTDCLIVHPWQACS
jgi:hypothetical protein